VCRRTAHVAVLLCSADPGGHAHPGKLCNSSADPGGHAHPGKLCNSLSHTLYWGDGVGLCDCEVLLVVHIEVDELTVECLFLFYFNVV